MDASVLRTPAPLNGALGFTDVYRKFALLAWVVSSAVLADPPDKQFPQPPEILVRLIEGAQEQGNELSSVERDGSSYYLQRAEYIGSASPDFGKLHVAEFFFVRSAQKGAFELPARGHTFLVFFDNSFATRITWRLDMPLTGFRFVGNSLFLDDQLLVDFTSLPTEGMVVVDGQPQDIPRWAK